jgi:hypothetical protein
MDGHASFLQFLMPVGDVAPAGSAAGDNTAPIAQSGPFAQPPPASVAPAGGPPPWSQSGTGRGGAGSAVGAPSAGGKALTVRRSGSSAVPARVVEWTSPFPPSSSLSPASLPPQSAAALTHRRTGPEGAVRAVVTATEAEGEGKGGERGPVRQTAPELATPAPRVRGVPLVQHRVRESEGGGDPLHHLSHTTVLTLFFLLCYGGLRLAVSSLRGLQTHHEARQAAAAALAAVRPIVMDEWQAAGPIVAVIPSPVGAVVAPARGSAASVAAAPRSPWLHAFASPALDASWPSFSGALLTEAWVQPWSHGPGAALKATLGGEEPRIVLPHWPRSQLLRLDGPPVGPTSSYNRPAFGPSAHLPLPPSWSLVQAGAGAAIGHHVRDTIMCGDGLGSCWSMAEVGAGAAGGGLASAQGLDGGGRRTPSVVRRQREGEGRSRPSLPRPLASPPMASRLAYDLPLARSRQGAVREAFQHAWRGYAAHAWGHDQLRPVTQGFDNPLGGVAATCVDALDTLLLMGLEDEFEAAEAVVLDKVSMISQEDVNLFESTIRVLGGLLSAYELTNRTRPALLERATHVADALAFAFESPSGAPYGTLGMKSRRKYNPTWVAGSTLAEVATLQMEWEHLSYLTGDAKYALAVRKALAGLLAHEPVLDSLWPTFLNPEDGEWSSAHVTLGARADSAYETLLKYPLLAGLGRGGREWAVGHTRKAGGSPAPLCVTAVAHDGSAGDCAEGGEGSPNATIRDSWARLHLVTYGNVYGNPALLRRPPPGRVTFPLAGGLDLASQAVEALRAPPPGPPGPPVPVSAYAPPLAVSGGRAWAAASTADARTRYARYEAAAAEMLARAGLAPDAWVEGEGANEHTLWTSMPLPPFHPAAHLDGTAPSTPASEAAWFTSVLGAFWRSAAGVAHQLVRLSGGGPLPHAPAPASVVPGTEAVSPLVEPLWSPPAWAAEGEDEPAASDGPTGRYFYLSDRMGASDVKEVPVDASGSSMTLQYPAWSVDGKMDHLACFAPGLFALASTVGPTPALAHRMLALARTLMRTCVRTYSATATGIAPEISRFAEGAPGSSGEPSVDAGARHALLRPETVESLFVLYRVTGDETYRAWGWNIFLALNDTARVLTGGFASVKDVSTLRTSPDGTEHLNDGMETFVLAETFKYLFLLFGPSEEGDVHVQGGRGRIPLASRTLPLDKWVFNTEAHPLPVWPARGEARFT